MSDIYKDAFQKAFKKAYIPLTEKDLLIVDCAVDINERINKIDGIASSISHVSQYMNFLTFNFSISYNNQSASFSLKADKGKFLKDDPKFTVSSAYFSNEETEVSFENDQEIEKLLVSVVTLVGQQVGEKKTRTDIEDALARRRLMSSMPQLVYNKS